jgi:hypothetical protein
MALPIISDVFRCAVRATLGDQEVVNVYHLLNGVTAVPQDIADDLGHAIATSIAGYQTQFLHYVDIAVTPLDGATATSIVVPADFPIDGTLSEACLGAQCAAIITWSTGIAGRSYRGRTYVGGIPISYLNDEGTRFVDAAVENYQSAGDSLLSSLDGTHGNLSALVVASYVHSTAAPVTRCTARQYQGTQRRRVD